MLSRAQMEDVIRNGGSVLHGGRLITRVEHLPTDADLAAGNPEQEAMAAAALEAQIAALQAQHARLTQARMPQSGRAPAINPEHLGALQGAAVPQGDLATDLRRPGQFGIGGEHPFVTIIGQELANRLVAAGYNTPEAIASASDEQLREVEGVGPKTLDKLRAAYGRGGKE